MGGQRGDRGGAGHSGESATAAAEPWCAPDALSVRTSAPGSPGDATQIHFDVILTNTSSQACTLQGYPGVDLIGPDDPMWGPDYQLPQQAGDPQPVTLAPGASAASRLTFLPDPNGWVPSTIAVTLPNAPGRLETPWIGRRRSCCTPGCGNPPGHLCRSATAHRLNPAPFG